MVNLEKIKLKKCQPPSKPHFTPFLKIFRLPPSGGSNQNLLLPFKKEKGGGGGVRSMNPLQKKFYPPTPPVNNNFHVINFLHYPSPSGGGNSSHPLTPYGKSYNIVNFMFVYL